MKTRKYASDCQKEKRNVKPKIDGALGDQFNSDELRQVLQQLVSNPRRIGKGTLIASFDLEAPCGIKVIGAMLLEKGGKRWINFPSREWPREDGTRGFAPLLEWTDSAARARFQRAVVPLAEKA